MRLIKGFFRFLFSRRLWVFIGVALLCALIWQFGPIVMVGKHQPLETEMARLITIAVILVLWLFSILLAELRSARKNRMFVTDLAAPPPVAPDRPGTANVAEINTKFQQILGSMRKSKLGSRKFLRDMPWYVIIGPPGTGKTTALKQSGLHFPIDLSDDIKGIGGTRNCDWFFTDSAVLVDTAGRYVQQMSDPEVDAAEWFGFLDMLKRHRGKRALNGVIVTLSLQELFGPEASLRQHGKEIRRRLTELRERLQIQLPVYLLITKADLVPGFETFFADLSTRDREQVWGTTLPTEARAEGTAIAREFRALVTALETRVAHRMDQDSGLPPRAQVFRFPAQVDRIEAPLRILIETVFGESRYEESPWLRGFYLSSATQEGSPLDRLLSEMSSSYGLCPEPPPPRAHRESRSYFLRDLMSDVIFPEAGLGLFDRAAEERRVWMWRGTVALATLVTALAGLAFLYSYLRFSGAIDDQVRQVDSLSDRLANIATRQAPTDPLDLPLALEAVSEVANAQSPVDTSLLTLAGPTAAGDLGRAHKAGYDRALRNILEPRMLALLEATMWREIRNPEYLLGALKAYHMMTGQATYDADFLSRWWQEELPGHTPIDPFPTEAALSYQLDAINRMRGEESFIAHDPKLVSEALISICTVPLSVRAYNILRLRPEVTALEDWLPATAAGPNAPRVLTRLSGKTLRVGLPGLYTYDGFHTVVVPLIPEIAAQSALDRQVFEGGCPESSDVSVETLEADIIKLYSDDFIAQWDGFLRDVRLAPLTDLATATASLKDLGSPDSAMKRLLVAVVAETDLTRPPPEESEEEGVDPALAGKAKKKLGKIGKLVETGSKLLTGGEEATEAAFTTQAQTIADHFAPLKATVAEVDGVPPLLTDAEAALAALAAELQTVAASPDPQAALLARGGLPQLTGALANVAAPLPDPIDDWLSAIAGDTISVTREAIVAQLNARWRADVLPFCTSATTGRYPFEVGSAIDVNVPDFQRLFGPNGLIDSFTNTHLLQYVDTTVRPWKWRADFGLDAATLTPFEQARSIRDALFPGGAGPIMSFALEPKDLSPNAARVTLNVDGQQLVYFNSASRPAPMTWPGKDGTNLISITFTPVDGTGEVITTETGSWAWLRLMRKSRLTPAGRPDLFSLTLALGGYSADFTLTAMSVENPYDLSMFGNFKCPETF